MYDKWNFAFYKLDKCERQPQLLCGCFQTWIVCSNTTLLKLQTVLFLFFSKFCTSKLGVRLIYGCGLYMDVYGMPSSRIRNPSPSQFHLVLTKLTELQEKLNTMDQSSVIAQLRRVNNSLQIVEGNQTDISDAILNKLLSMEMRIKTGFKALE